MSESGESPIVSSEAKSVLPTFKDRLQSRITDIKNKIGSRFGLVSVAQKTETTKGERQLNLTNKIIDSLVKKDALATPVESLELYKSVYGMEISPYQAPEIYLSAPYPTGNVRIDETTDQPKIYLNPMFRFAPPDEKLSCIIEEAIHYYQIKHGEVEFGNPESTVKSEVKAKDKILKIADYLELGPDEIEMLKHMKDVYIKALALNTERSSE